MRTDLYGFYAHVSTWKSPNWLKEQHRIQAPLNCMSYFLFHNHSILYHLFNKKMCKIFKQNCFCLNNHLLRYMCFFCNLSHLSEFIFNFWIDRQVFYKFHRLFSNFRIFIEETIQNEQMKKFFSWFSRIYSFVIHSNVNTVPMTLLLVGALKNCYFRPELYYWIA